MVSEQIQVTMDDVSALIEGIAADKLVGEQSIKDYLIHKHLNDAWLSLQMAREQANAST